MRRRLCSALWIVLSGLALTSASVREVEDPKSTNWPRFRGPAGLGHAEDPGFPSEFELKDAAWKINLSGVGHSSPVVWEDGVYITSEAEGGTRLITRFQLSDGKPVWTHIDQFEAHRQHDLNSFAAATPALDEHGVYLVWTDGEKLVGLALDHEGETLWERELGPYRAQHGSGASPVVHDGVLLVVGDHEIEEETSYLLGLDCKTGEEVWRRERTSARASYATPFVRESSDGEARAIFASTAHGMTCLDPSNGEMIWEVDGIFQQRCVGSPVFVGDVLFCSAGSGGGGKESIALRVPSDGSAPKAEPVWKLTRSLPYVPTGVVKDGLLFLWSDGGIVSCVRGTDGEVLWRERVEGRFFGSPICVGERLFAQSMDGELVVLQASSEFKLLGRVDLGHPSQATPAVAGETLLLRTEKTLMAIRG